MNEKNRENVRLTDRDTMLGKFLTQEMTKWGVGADADIGPCPGIDVLDAFYNGTIQGEDREKTARHIALCPECFALFSDSAGAMGTLQEAEKPQKRRILAYAIPVAFAAGIALFFVLRVLFTTGPTPEIARQETKPQEVKPGPGTKEYPSSSVKTTTPLPGKEKQKKQHIPPAAYTIARLLMKSANAENNAGLIAYSREQAARYGFSRGEAPERTAFMTGVAFVDLEVLISANDREAVAELIDRIALLVKSLGSSTESIAHWSGVAEKIREGASLTTYADISGVMLKSITNSDAALYTEFGSWTEGGRIAALSGNRQYFRQEDLDYFIKYVSRKGMPEGIMKSLAGVKEITAQERLSDADMHSLAKKFKIILDTM